MRNWQEVSRRDPCRICGKPDWCAMSADGTLAVCRRVDTGEGIRRVDKAGGEFWLYRPDGSRTETRHVQVPSRPSMPCADATTRDAVYRALLAMLPLIPKHRQDLRTRGLNDKEIVRRGYRTLPLQGRASLAKRLVEQFGADTCAQNPGLYVAEQDGRCWWSLAGAAGLLIPARDHEGRVVSLKVRADEAGEGPRYTTVSSTKHGGPGPGCVVHVPLHAGVQPETVRLTEGELKSDVATVLSGTLTIALPGVSMWRQGLPVVQTLQPRQVLLAFDADWRTNPHVAQALKCVALAIVKAGVEVQVEDWDPTFGKGIDNLLAAGHLPAVRSATLVFGALVRGQARVWTGTIPTRAVEEIPAWH